MENLWLIIGKADNVPIVMMIPLFAYYSWLAFKQATANDRLIADGRYSELQEEGKDRIFTWPLLTRNEFLCAILIMVILTVWSVALDAPLEQGRRGRLRRSWPPDPVGARGPRRVGHPRERTTVRVLS